jgi:hypothetical protein
MSHFAKLDENNIVIFVTVGRQEDDGKEQELCDRTGDVYRQTSYNTRGGVHYDPVTNQPSFDQSKAFRKNYAGLGYTYDETRDAFIPPQPYPSWILNEFSCLWDAPVPYPHDGKKYQWSEDDQIWLKMPDAN